MSTPPSGLTRAQIAYFFAQLAAQRPNPTTELMYRNPFELLIAVILSAQATDVSVNKATATLFAAADNPADMLALGVDGIRAHIRSIGLAATKAANVHKTCALLLERHIGQVPSQRADLEALAGVGRKTANVVLNTAFGQPTLAVDTHIFRVANRTGLAPGKNVLVVEKNLLAVIPAPYLLHAHHWLLLHGRYTCKAQKPRCHDCVVSRVCQWPARFEHGAPALDP